MEKKEQAMRNDKVMGLPFFDNWQQNSISCLRVAQRFRQKVFCVWCVWFKFHCRCYGKIVGKVLFLGLGEKIVCLLFRCTAFRRPLLAEKFVKLCIYIKYYCVVCFHSILDLLLPRQSRDYGQLIWTDNSGNRWFWWHQFWEMELIWEYQNDGLRSQ